MYTTLNYSPNFDVKKRSKKEIKFVIFHYTGMKKENEAINKLTSEKSKVSSHYFIKKNGEILTLVPDLYIAWHAGISSWKNYNSINKMSIGIEISNPGHDYNYKKFSKKQINSIIILSKYLIKKYNISSNHFLGHSDISPERKKDPGEKFPWELLAKHKIGIWHGLSKSHKIKNRNYKLNKKEELNFAKNLIKIGYLTKKNFSNTKHRKPIIEAFQRRFRQELINGDIDKECLLISTKLVKNLNKTG